jgi:uncharacterized protein (DUF1697 family)
VKYVALLRGINVGGKRVIRMADLRAMFEASGGTNVVTYIQSGNVVFDHAARSSSTLSKQLGTALSKAAGFDVELVVRTAKEFDAAIADSPFPAAAPESMHVMFLPGRVAAESLGSLEPKTFAPDRFVLTDRDVYLCLPNGLGNSKLAATLFRHKALAGGTYRNWRTVLALAALTTKG